MTRKKLGDLKMTAPVQQGMMMPGRDWQKLCQIRLVIGRNSMNQRFIFIINNKKKT